jgi:signal-transduction protein with cAMP-binding, CBS, and nucleotidyltransferase domain
MTELNIVEKVIALEAVDLLKNLNPDQLSRIAYIASEISLPPGRTVLDAEQPQDALFVVLDGAVEIAGADGKTLHTARQNEVLGTWALFDTEPLRIKAVTVEDTKLLRIARDDFYDLLADNTEITAAIFSTLVKRFRQLVGQ